MDPRVNRKADTVNTLATYQPTSTSIETHHAAWTGPAGRTRAAEAVRDHDADMLTSLVWAYAYERNTDVSPHTVRSYALGVRRFVAWAQDTGVNLLRPAKNVGTGYRAHLQSSLGPGSANTRLTAARVLYNALEWVGLEAVNPFRNVKRVRDPRPAEKVRDQYSAVTVALMLQHAQDDLDRLIVLLGAGSGARAAEMASLTWDDINLEDGTAHVIGKGNRPGTLYLTQETVETLERQPHRTGSVLRSPRNTQDETAASASTLRYRAARMARAAGETKPGQQLGVHRLRHRYGTALAERYGLGVAQSGMRHASPTTTSRYVKERDRQLQAFAEEHNLAS